MIWALNLLICYLLAVRHSGKASADVSMGTFFPKVNYDFSEITWAHGVNSRMQLEESLKDETMMLEADISFGTVRGHLSDLKEPIMAHPPEVESDISLIDWLDAVIKKKSKGIKLDFKSTDVLEPSLVVLRERFHEMNFPVWINADILPGPVRSTTAPVDAKTFLRLCKIYLPHSTISPSWTTFLDSNVAATEKLLNWTNVYDMVMVLRDVGIDQNVTFPVRAAFVGASLEQLEWLLDVVPLSTLTIWSGKKDQVDVKDLLVLRKAVPTNAVFYDLPSPLNEQFHLRKYHLGDITYNRIPSFPNYAFSIDSGSVILGSRTMIIAGPCSATFKNPLVGSKAGIKVFSTVLEFLGDSSNEQASSIVLTFGESRIEINTSGSIQYGSNSKFTIEDLGYSYRMFKIEILLANDGEKYMVALVRPLGKISEISEVSSYLAYKFTPDSPESVFKIISADHGMKVLRNLKTDLNVWSASGSEKHNQESSSVSIARMVVPHKQTTGGVTLNLSNYEEPLCCCEFIDYRGARSHVMAACCDCDVLDDTCEKMITGNSVPPENYNTLWMIVHDRFRVPCCGGRGAMKIEPSVVLPIFLVPGMIFFAALGPVWTVVAVTAIPLLWVYLQRRFLRHSPRTRFFFVWALGSLIFLISVMEIEVLPYMEIYLYENILHKALVAALLFFIYITKGDPGVLERYSAEVSLMMDDAEVENRCSICNVLQLNRAGHCRLCNTCISKRDHHCIWLDSCIGAKNHRSFLFALIFLVLCSYYGSLLTLTTICEPMLVLDVFLIPRDCSGVYDNIHLAVCFVSALYALAIMIVSLCALGHQIYLVSIDTTLQEWRFARRNGPSRKVCNSCSLMGVCLNWYNFCRGHR